MGLLRNEKNVIIINTDHKSCEKTFETIVEELKAKTFELRK